MFGVDAPNLFQMIKTELENETNVLQGKMERTFVSIGFILLVWLQN